jgi:uncharacterized protein (TIGR02284 family)
MSNPSATLLQVEASVHTVIDHLIDSQKAFKTIGEELKDPTLKLYFLDESLARAEFRGDLESILHHEGIHDIAEGGTISGALNRVWGELKARLGGGDLSLLETADHSESEAIKIYTAALHQELPFPVRQKLSTQAGRIQLFQEYVRRAILFGRASASE